MRIPQSYPLLLLTSPSALPTIIILSSTGFQLGAQRRVYEPTAVMRDTGERIVCPLTYESGRTASPTALML
jgi:hypothetical protein